MRKDQSVKEIDNYNHILSLKPNSNECYFRSIITCSFLNEQTISKTGTNIQKYSKRQIDFPTFNKDRNYATPTFTLPSEKEHFIETANKLKLEHDRKIAQYIEQKTQLWQPKPKSKNRYCGVCKDNYDDYIKHIHSCKHTKKININIFNKDIISLCSKLKKKQEGLGQNSNISNLLNEQNNSQLFTREIPTKMIKISTSNSTKQGSQSYINNRQLNINPPNIVNQEVSSYQKVQPVFHQFSPILVQQVFLLSSLTPIYYQDYTPNNHAEYKLD